jgi:AcrR family transcriptional regulator
MARTREFDLDDALDRAMLVFWAKGYDGASISDLTEAMCIERPSLYAAFGNKEQLFELVMERYFDGPAGYGDQALDQPKARDVAHQLLSSAADLHTAPGTPAGCLGVHGALVGSDTSEVQRDNLVAVRHADEARLRKRFERAIDEGDLPADADAAGLTMFIRTVTYGMAIRAVEGATRRELECVIDQAMQAWPDGS